MPEFDGLPIGFPSASTCRLCQRIRMVAVTHCEATTRTAATMYTRKVIRHRRPGTTPLGNSSSEGSPMINPRSQKEFWNHNAARGSAPTPWPSQ
jgi:hypothetical protein